MDPDSSDSDGSSDWDISSTRSTDTHGSLASQKPLNVSIRFFLRLDSMVRVAGEDTEERLRKTATLFSLLVFATFGIPFTAALSLIVSVRTVIVTSGFVAASGLAAYVMVRYKEYRSFPRIFAHAMVFSLQAAIFIGSAPGGVFFSDGMGKAWAPGSILYQVPTAVAAFIFRESKWIFRHVLISLGLLYFTVAFWWNSPGLSTMGVIATTGYIMGGLIVEALILAFFCSISDSLSMSAAAATAEMRDAVHSAQAERKANAAKTRFVSVMSHEIRNPLQAVVLQLEMLEETRMSGEQASLVKGITRSSAMLLAIVNDVLDVTKIEAGAVTLEEIPFDVRDVAEAVIDTYAPKAAQKGVDLFLTLDPTIPTGVLGDPTRLRQVLANYVGNALKFTSEGEIELCITTDAAMDPPSSTAEDGAPHGTSSGLTPAALEANGTPIPIGAGKRRRRRAPTGNGQTQGTFSLAAPLWTFAVRDTGPGINKVGQRKLFREFAQVDESTTREFGGTGLGLFICKQLSELMGGGVGIQSTPGVGSTFLAQARLLPDPAGYTDYFADIAMPTSDTSITHPKGAPRAAVVASNCRKLADSIAAAVEAVMGKAYGEACTVEAAYSVQAMLQRIDRYPPSTLLVVDGDSLSRKEERALRTKDVSRVVLLRSEMSPKVRRELIEGKGWVHVLGKPAMLTDVVRVLVAAIGGSATFNTLRPPKPGQSSGGGRARSRKRSQAAPKTRRLSSDQRKLSADHSRVSARSSSSAASGVQRNMRRSIDSMQSDIYEGLAHQASPPTRVRSGRTKGSGSAAAATARRAADAAHKPFVLVVDDFQLVRDLVCRVVENLGYPVIFAPNGKVAVDKVTELYDSIGMIVMDCEMPVMDGFEATRLIREYEASIGIDGTGGRVPICSMTANAMREDIQKCLDLGMDDFLSKPVRKQALMEKLKLLYRSTPARDKGDSLLRMGSAADPGDVRASSQAVAPEIAPPAVARVV